MRSYLNMDENVLKEFPNVSARDRSSILSHSNITVPVNFKFPSAWAMAQACGVQTEVDALTTIRQVTLSFRPVSSILVPWISSGDYIPCVAMLARTTAMSNLFPRADALSANCDSVSG